MNNTRSKRWVSTFAQKCAFAFIFSWFILLPNFVFAAQLMQKTETCPIPPPGKNYVIYTKVVGDGSYPPASPQQFCVLVDRGASSIGFGPLVTAGIVQAQWLTSGVRYAQSVCGQNEFFYPPTPRTDQLSNTSFPLSATTDGCGVLGNPVIRYEIRTGGEDSWIYLYYLGVAGASSVAQVACSDAKQIEPCNENLACFWANNTCNSKTDRTICPSLDSENCVFSQACEWDRTSNRCISRLENQLGNQNGKPEGYKGPITDCAFKGTCRDLNDLLDLGIQIAKYLFGFLGTVALGFFVYGGFLITSSMGNSEKVSEGKGVLVAAVMGIIVCFAAYAAVNFLLDLLQVGSEFRIIGN